jgi:hypothetical protein
MKKPHRASEAEGNSADGTARYTLADSHLCPFADECRRMKEDPEKEGASCLHCGQFFTRAELARIFAGYA